MGNTTRRDFAMADLFIKKAAECLLVALVVIGVSTLDVWGVVGTLFLLGVATVLNVLSVKNCVRAVVATKRGV